MSTLRLTSMQGLVCLWNAEERSGSIPRDGFRLYYRMPNGPGESGNTLSAGRRLGRDNQVCLPSGKLGCSVRTLS